MLRGSVILSGSVFSQRISGVGTPSATAQESVTLPPASVSPSHRHTGREGGAADKSGTEKDINKIKGEWRKCLMSQRGHMA